MGILSSIDAKLEAKKNQLLPKSGWGSRKLWIFAGIAMTLVWLGRGNLVIILDGIIYLTAVYLVAQVIQDVGEAWATAWAKREHLRCDAAVAIEKLKHPAPVVTPAVPAASP